MPRSDHDGDGRVRQKMTPTGTYVVLAMIIGGTLLGLFALRYRRLQPREDPAATRPAAAPAADPAGPPSTGPSTGSLRQEGPDAVEQFGLVARAEKADPHVDAPQRRALAGRRRGKC